MGGGGGVRAESEAAEVSGGRARMMGPRLPREFLSALTELRDIQQM